MFQLASAMFSFGIMANQPAPPNVPPLRNKGLIAGLLEGNQWLSEAPLQPKTNECPQKKGRCR